jgi:uncharacterized membrane protein
VSPLTGRRDRGSVALLVLGYVAIAAVLVGAGIDVSKVFLAQRALSAAADDAALAGAQALDRAAVYSGGAAGLACGGVLPLDPAAASAAADASLGADVAGLHQTFAALDPPEVAVSGGVVHVELHGAVRVPVAGVLARLLPRHRAGLVRVGASAAASSPTRC